MKIGVIRTIKNLSMLFLKMLCVCGFILIVLNISLGFIETLSSEYSHYTLVRGLEKYGVTETAYLKENKSDGGLNTSVYEYIIDDVEYTIKVHSNLSVSIDESVEILYDSINPSVNIEKSVVDGIDSFYSDIMKQGLFLYIRLILFVIILGFFWFCIDLIKYSKFIWKKYI